MNNKRKMKKKKNKIPKNTRNTLAVEHAEFLSHHKERKCTPLMNHESSQ
jgi:hypothetical protein